MSREKVIDEALKSIEKQFGKGAIMKLWDNKNLWSLNTFHSGSYLLDMILGWGYVEWRVVEIYWPESSGKTTVTLHAIAEVQKRWEVAAFIDAEHALDPEYAAKLGVNLDELLLAQPDYGEQALSIAEELAKTWAVKLIVIDSVAALVPRAEVEGDMGDSHMWLQARMMSQGLRKLTSILAKTGTTLIFINQIRMKIGVMFGNPETTTWGNALKFYASQRLEIRRWDKIEKDKEQVWYVAKIKVVKNKVAPPFKKADIAVIFSKWFEHVTDVVETALLLKLITRAGAFYTLEDQKFQGRDNLIAYLSTDEAKRAHLEKHIQKTIKAMRTGAEPMPEWIDITGEDDTDSIDDVQSLSMDDDADLAA
jgi:recombination protein RecA